MLCLSGFELYSRWVPLKLCQTEARRSVPSSETSNFWFPFIARSETSAFSLVFGAASGNRSKCDIRF